MYHQPPVSVDHAYTKDQSEKKIQTFVHSMLINKSYFQWFRVIIGEVLNTKKLCTNFLSVIKLEGSQEGEKPLDKSSFAHKRCFFIHTRLIIVGHHVTEA